MKKTKYAAPAVMIIRIETSYMLASSDLSVGYSDETTTGDANARGYGFDDFDDEDMNDEPMYGRGKSSYVW